MGLTSLQVCMDTSQWLQVDEMGIIDSSSPSEEIIPCSRPLPERRLRPQHDQALKCPRCDSNHTKFCYYNNYSLSQPRYFCKTCRRYWTQGGTIRNIPVGGSCRKNKRVPIRKTSVTPLNQHPTSPPTDLNLSFSGGQLSHLNTLMGVPINTDHMESKLDSIIGSLRNHDFNGPGDLGHVGGGLGDVGHHGSTYYSFNSLCSPFGFSMDGNHDTFMDTCEKLVLDPHHTTEMKPSNKILGLEWQDQGCSDVGKDTFGYLNGLGSWSGMMNSYESSATNPMV